MGISYLDEDAAMWRNLICSNMLSCVSLVYVAESVFFRYANTDGYHAIHLETIGE